MKPSHQRLLDSRRAAAIVQALLARQPAYVPDWMPPEKESEAALIWIYARYIETILQRLNQAPDKNKLAFLDLFIDMIPAQAARVPLVFRMAENAPVQRASAGIQAAAPPPPESTDQVIFETERDAGLAPVAIKEAVSLWAGRDQYINHSPALVANESFQPFNRRQLVDTPHHIYIAHNRLLALAGQARVLLDIDLIQGSSEHLGMTWGYWDGEVWRSFKSMDPACTNEDEEKLDGTDGFRRSGKNMLLSDCAEAKEKSVNGIEAFWIQGRLEEPLPPDPAQILPLVDSIQVSTEIVRPLEAVLRREFITDKLGGGKFNTLIDQIVPLADALSLVSTTASGDEYKYIDPLGLEPDLAFADAQTLNTSKTFYPLGQQPQPGNVFYFHNTEILSKPGAQVTIYVAKTKTPADDLNGPTNPPQGKTQPEPDLRWEYWNGSRWQRLAVQSNPPPSSAKAPLFLNQTGVITFTVPTDLRPVTVNDQEAPWIRARLHSGGYGFMDSVSITGSTGTFEFFINQPPALSALRLGYSWQDGPAYPQHVLTYNDFQYEDHTADATWPGRSLALFKLLRDVTPALYLGFDQALPVDRFNLFMDIEEEQGESEGPALLWDYWDGFNWRLLPIEDETNNLRLPGMVSLIGPSDSQPFARFANESLHWLRARLKEDGPPGSPTFHAIYPNAAWAAQRQTIINEPLGNSDGRPNQVFTFRQLPILPGEQIEVRELAGARANVEWRLLAVDILGDDYSIIQEIEDLLRREGPQSEIAYKELRFERDRQKRVSAVWVPWSGRDHLYFSKPGDRHYVLDRSRGRLHFGDGTQGRVPPAGTAILVRRYLSGGGLSGNVQKETISQLLSGLGGVEAVFNPKPGEGGAEARNLAEMAALGPLMVHHRGRALLPRDFETMAYEASAAVAVARVLSATDDDGRERPGWVTLVIIPESAEERPWPTFGLRQKVQRYIAVRAGADLKHALQIFVTGPDYQPVDVHAVIIPQDIAQAGPVEQQARQVISDFLHPLHGGPQKKGWTPGKAVYVSDIAAILARMEGVDYVQELSLLSNGALQGEKLAVGRGRIAVAGQIRIRIEAEGRS